jgi:hypothetical protein
MTAFDGYNCGRKHREEPKHRKEQRRNSHHLAVFQIAERSGAEEFRGGRRCRSLLSRCENSKNSRTRRAAADVVQFYESS